MLLDVYTDIGYSLSYLDEYRELFERQTQTTFILELIYEDILKFHRLILKVLNRPGKFVVSKFLSCFDNLL